MKARLLILIFSFLFISSSFATYYTPGTGVRWSLDDLVANSGGVVTFGSGFYTVNDTIKVKANQPVEITLDNTVRGCYRAFTIRALGVSEYSADPSNKVTFTPTQKGTFGFACTMGMGTGTIIVE